MNEVIGSKATTQGRVRALLAFVLLIGMAVVGFSGNPASAAPLPTFPDNLVVFPERDFISAEGFDSHVGENALVQAIRPGVGVVGGAEVTLGPGGVPFEINHPGGYCWGNDIAGFRDGADPNTIPKITPDLQPGDQIVLTFANGDQTYGASTDIVTQDAYVTAVSAVTPDSPELGQDPTFDNRFTVTGHIGASVISANTEQRIVNPDLTDTTVAKRDIRAVPGGFAPNNTGVYLSNLDFPAGTDTFVATYLFADPDVAALAATGGGERLLSWQATDIAANRQGITISEFGELGGPGFGGCPLGPNQSGPPAPSNVDTRVVTTGTGSQSIEVTWDPAVSIPGAPPITGYRVHAVETGTTATDVADVGRRINDPNATGTTITGLDGGVTYDVQVVSMSPVGETFPAVRDTVAPVLTADPVPGVYPGEQIVTLSTDDADAQIWYTTDGTDVLDSAGDPGPTADLLTGSIPVGVTTTVKAVAFDPSGNASAQSSFVYTINTSPVPPTDLSAIAARFSVDLTWTEADPTITGYGLQLHQNGTAQGAPIEVVRAVGSGQSVTISNLVEETTYGVTVMAGRDPGTGIVYGDPSVEVSFTTSGAPPLIVADAGADQTVARGDIVTLTGSSSAATGFTWEQISPDPIGAPVEDLVGAGTATPSFTFPTTMLDPVTFELTVTDGVNEATDTVVVFPQAVVANAGADQTVVRGDVVSLDGTGSTPSNGNLSFSWASSEAAVTLDDPTSPTPSFTFPATVAGPVTLTLTVDDASTDSHVDTVTVSALDTDPLALARAEYRTGRNEWRFAGTASVLVGNDITIRLNHTDGGLTTSTVLTTGPVPVDGVGAWAVRFNPGNLDERPVGAGSYTVTITSSQGGLLLDQPITTRR